MSPPDNMSNAREPLPFERQTVLITTCCRCGRHPIMIDPYTAITIPIHHDTGTPVDTAGRPARPDDPHVQHEALCEACIRLCRQAAATGTCVSWPMARTRPQAESGPGKAPPPA